MADINKLLPLILRWEGGFSNHPKDRGGATNKGVTLTTWLSCGYDKDADGDIDVDDLRLITEADVLNCVLRPMFWNRWKADRITNQAVANICVDWGWNSGVQTSIKRVQRILGVAQDGIVGNVTLGAINGADQCALFNKIWAARKAFFQDIVRRNPSQRVFLTGWLNRLNSFKFSDR